ncbi:hypothetical protein BDAP_001318 [Binucleata daphniae]
MKLNLTIKNVKDFLVELQDEKKFEEYYLLIPLICKNANKEIFEYIKKYKGNVKYITALVQSLCYENTTNSVDINIHNINVSNENKDGANNIILAILEYLHDILYKFDDPALIDAIFNVYKMYEIEYNTKIMYYLENIKVKRKENLIRHAIKYFDVSDCMLKNTNERYNFEERILAYFWKVTNSDFFDLENFVCEIRNLQDFAIACNYLLFCYENVKHYNVLNENFEFCYDGISAMKMVFDKIKNEIERYIENISRESNGNEHDSTHTNNIKNDTENNTEKNKENDIKINTVNNSKNDIKNNTVNNSKNDIKNDIENISNAIEFDSINANNKQQFDVKQKLKELKEDIKNKKNNNNLHNKPNPIKNVFDSVFIGNVIKIAQFINFKYEIIFYGTENEILNCLKMFTSDAQNNLCFSFFDYLKNNNTEMQKITNISKFFSKKLKNIDVTQKVIDLLEHTNLYDSCFLYFTKFLDSKQCEVLLSKIKSKKMSKFEKSMIKKVENVCKSSPVLESKEVYKF